MRIEKVKENRVCGICGGVPRKAYVVEKKGGWDSWKPCSVDSIKKAAKSRMKLYREQAKIYRTNKHYRVVTDIAKEE